VCENFEFEKAEHFASTVFSTFWYSKHNIEQFCENVQLW